MDAYSDYDTSFSVRPYPCDGEDNASSEPPHLHVRFSHHVVNAWIDDSDDEEIESRTICLTDDLLAEKSGDDCRNFIFSEALCDWLIDVETLVDIADQVVEKARRLRCDLQVDIRSVQW
nr:E3 ubiquitin-protein ligase CIP8-like [Ipomoea trifida]GMD44715.1 E3 ubiquitin-protein ligase CIP8-like [Ipomoea batatas]